MPRLLLLVATLLVLATAQASDVFVTKDAQGRLIYTDRPDSLPAEKVGVASKPTDKIATQLQYEQKMKSYSAADKANPDATKNPVDARAAKQLSAADKVKRCEDSRARYQNVMNSHRLYEQGATPEDRRYLDSNEMDAARANAKKVMDEFCAE
jgi:hypothetical protein